MVIGEEIGRGVGGILGVHAGGEAARKGFTSFARFATHEISNNECFHT